MADKIVADTEKAMTVADLEKAIKEYYPEGTDAEWNLMKLSLVLQSQGTSIRKVLEKGSIKGSPFIKLSTRT